jgi:4-hydroxybenzoate polyprenyltransferase
MDAYRKAAADDAEREPLQVGDAAVGEPPLCVDLDGTLVRSDLLFESLLALLRRRPLFSLWLPLWWARGRARLKHEIAQRASVDVTLLPYREELLMRLRAERARGRRLVLATASDGLLADSVARHLGVFDEIIASNGEVNLKGLVKRDALTTRFGERGFDYVGDAWADRVVWSSSRESWLVGVSPRTVAHLRSANPGVRVVVASAEGRASALFRALRLHQWVKNLLLFVPLVAAHRLFDRPALGRTAAGFLALGLVASGVYLLNDLVDLEHDRRHKHKRDRPFASGHLSLAAGAAFIPVLVLAGGTLAWAVSPALLAVVALYLATTTAYSFALKRIVMLDVLVLALLYTLRVFAGSVTADVVVSKWLLIFSIFLFLSLALIKRLAELQGLRERGAPGDQTGRGYRPEDLEILASLGAASGYIAVVVLALFVSSDDVTKLYAHPSYLWAACPLLLFWVSRIWLLAHRGEVQSDPIVFAIRDRVSYAVAAAMAVILLAASR